MVDDQADDISVDDVLEEERSGRLNTAVGDDELPEDNDPPSVDEPDHGEEGDAE